MSRENRISTRVSQTQGVSADPRGRLPLGKDGNHQCQGAVSNRVSASSVNQMETLNCVRRQGGNLASGSWFSAAALVGGEGGTRGVFSRSSKVQISLGRRWCPWSTNYRTTLPKPLLRHKRDFMPLSSLKNRTYCHIIRRFPSHLGGKSMVGINQLFIKFTLNHERGMVESGTALIALINSINIY